MIAQLRANAALARALVVELARLLPAERAASPIDTVLDQALITRPDARDPAMLGEARCGLREGAGGAGNVGADRTLAAQSAWRLRFKFPG